MKNYCEKYTYICHAFANKRLALLRHQLHKITNVFLQVEQLISSLRSIN